MKKLTDKDIDLINTLNKESKKTTSLLRKYSKAIPLFEDLNLGFNFEVAEKILKVTKEFNHMIDTFIKDLNKKKIFAKEKVHKDSVAYAHAMSKDSPKTAFKKAMAQLNELCE